MTSSATNWIGLTPNRDVYAAVPRWLSSQRIQSMIWLKPCSKLRDQSGVARGAFLKNIPGVRLRRPRAMLCDPFGVGHAVTPKAK